MPSDDKPEFGSGGWFGERSTSSLRVPEGQSLVGEVTIDIGATLRTAVAEALEWAVANADMNPLTGAIAAKAAQIRRGDV